MAALTEDDKKLLKEQQIAVVTTLRADGSLQSTPVWVDTDGEAVIFNTSKGRVKQKNLEQSPQLSVCVVDVNNTQRWVSVSGTAQTVEDGALEHVNQMAKKYLGVDEYPYLQEGEERIIVKVVPSRRIGS